MICNDFHRIRIHALMLVNFPSLNRSYGSIKDEGKFPSVLINRKYHVEMSVLNASLCFDKRNNIYTPTNFQCLKIFTGGLIC